MNTTTKGNAFECRVYKYIRKKLNSFQLGLAPQSARVFRKRAYISRISSEAIIADVSVEVTLRGQATPSLLWIFECTDCGRRLGVDKCREFHSTLEEIGSDSTKGTLITTAAPQSGALSYARSHGMGIIQFEHHRWKRLLPSFIGIASVQIPESSRAMVPSGGRQPSMVGCDFQREVVRSAHRAWLSIFLGGVLAILALLHSSKSTVPEPTSSEKVQRGSINAHGVGQAVDASRLNNSPLLSRDGAGDRSRSGSIEDTYADLDKSFIRWSDLRTAASIDVLTVFVEPERLFLLTGNTELLRFYGPSDRMEAELQEPLRFLWGYLATFRAIAKSPRAFLLRTEGLGGGGADVRIRPLRTVSHEQELNEDVLRSVAQMEKLSVIGGGWNQHQRCLLCRLSAGADASVGILLFVYQAEDRKDNWQSGIYVICPPLSVQSLETLAKQGNSDALVRLARIHLRGGRVERNLERALNYYRIAADTGDGRAQEDIQRLLSGQNVQSIAVREQIRYPSTMEERFVAGDAGLDRITGRSAVGLSGSVRHGQVAGSIP